VLKSQRVPVWERQQEVKVGWSTQPHQQEQQIQNRVRSTTGYESGRCGKPLGLPQSAWPSLQAQQQNQLPRHNGSGTRGGYLGGSGAKRESAGTGVFLPRRYNSAPECCKKTGTHLKQVLGIFLAFQIWTTFFFSFFGFYLDC
jgi:hypothetical protein